MNSLGKAIRWFKVLTDQNNELIWANVWHDTKSGIEWMRDVSGLSPGRWAV